MNILKKLFSSKESKLPYTPLDTSKGATVYLTKQENGQIHHFRVKVENSGVSVVHGVMHNWLAKYWQGCGKREAAVKRQQELVDEKLKEGFEITSFKELPENTVTVYDKAKWHFSTDYPELDYFNNHIPTGMFLGWLIDNNLVSEEFIDDNEEQIEEFKQQKLTGAQILESGDGALAVEQLNKLGNRFALTYFESSSSQYLQDYKETLAENLPSLYHVADTWDNYKKMKEVLDKRFFDWKEREHLQY